MYFYCTAIMHCLLWVILIASAAAKHTVLNTHPDNRKGDCRAPPKIENGYLKQRFLRKHPSFRHNQVVRYKCNANFTIISSISKAICHSGHWRRYNLACIPVCGAPPDLENGHVDTRFDHRLLGRRMFGAHEVVRYRCNKGHSNCADLGMAVCRNSQWSVTRLCCSENCTSPPVVRNAVHNESATQNNFSEGAVVKYTCEKHYLLRGSEKAFCKNGLWTVPKLFCESSGCGKPPMLKNGHIHRRFSKRSHFREHEIVRYSCNDGYSLKSVFGMAVCQGKVWKHFHIQCTKNCGLPPNISGADYHASKMQKSFTHGTILHYVCHNGFILNSTDKHISICTHGSWSQPSLQCDQGNYCGSPPVIEGTIRKDENQSSFLENSMVKYSCINGFGNESTQSAICKNGSWVGPFLSCDVKPPSAGTCLTHEINNGFIISSTGITLHYTTTVQNGETTMVMCESGFTAIGINQQSCINGIWSRPFPSCDPASCSLKTLDKGVVKYQDSETLPESVPHNEEISIQCNPNLVPRNKTIKCSFGEWQNFPVCRHPRCPMNLQIKSGYVTYDTKDGLVANFFCNEDIYLVDGAESIKCVDDNKWFQEPPRECYKGN